jgi:hypothetical protein
LAFHPDDVTGTPEILRGKNRRRADLDDTLGTVDGELWPAFPDEPDLNGVEGRRGNRVERDEGERCCDKKEAHSLTPNCPRPHLSRRYRAIPGQRLQ